MASRKSGLSARGKQAAKKRKLTKNKKIDFSDIPELTDKQLKSMKRVGRPPIGETTKVLIAIRISPELLEALRKLALMEDKPYQSYVHELLEEVVKTKKAA